MKLLSWLQNYNSRHSLLESGAYLKVFDDGQALLVYDNELISVFDLFDEDSVKEYLLNE